MLAVAHLAEEGEVFIRAAVAPGRILARFGQAATVGAHFFGALLVDIGVPGRDQIFRCTVHEVEIVAGEIKVRSAIFLPAEAQPLHHLDDAVDVLLLFLFRVGVVETHVADAVIIAGEAEVEENALGMTDMQVAVRFRREARADFCRVGLALGVVRSIAGCAGPAAGDVGAQLEIALDDVADEIGARRHGGFF